MGKKKRQSARVPSTNGRSGGGRAPSRGRLTAQAAAARKLAIEAARLAADDQCEDILVLDLRDMSPVCDYFMIATGTSDRQMRAVADHIEEMAAGMGESAYSVSGRMEGNWIVIDFVDTVIHLFDPDHRRYYDLEMLWGDAPKVRWQSRAKKTGVGAAKE